MFFFFFFSCHLGVKCRVSVVDILQLVRDQLFGGVQSWVRTTDLL